MRNDILPYRELFHETVSGEELQIRELRNGRAGSTLTW